MKLPEHYIRCLLAWVLLWGIIGLPATVARPRPLPDTLRLTYAEYDPTARFFS